MFFARLPFEANEETPYAVFNTPIYIPVHDTVCVCSLLRHVRRNKRWRLTPYLTVEGPPSLHWLLYEDVHTIFSFIRRIF